LNNEEQYNIFRNKQNVIVIAINISILFEKDNTFAKFIIYKLLLLRSKLLICFKKLLLLRFRLLSCFKSWLNYLEIILVLVIVAICEF